MEQLSAYLPVFLLVLAAMALLFITAADRSAQVTTIAAVWSRMFGGRTAHADRVRRRFPVKRIVFWLIVLCLISYIWTYQRVQDAIAVALVENEIEEVKIGSLIIPWSAFFRSAYQADAGFSRSKRRTRAEVAVQGYLWSGLVARIDESGLAKVNKVTGKKFVFSYLTDVEILRPAINKYMKQLMRGKQIDKYEIETFDNRGPYLIVALSPKNRNKDAATVATSLAKGLHTNLTETNQLKVNQVIIKVVDPEPYLSSKTINVIGRGKAGSY